MDRKEDRARLTQFFLPHPASSHPTTVKPDPQAADIAALSFRLTHLPVYRKQFWPLDAAMFRITAWGLDLALLISFKEDVDSTFLPSSPACAE